MLHRVSAAAVTAILACAAAPSMARAQPDVAPGPAKSAAPANSPENASPWPSDAVIQMTKWVVASGDNGGLPFMVIDKTAADLFVFDAQSQFVGSTPALLGSALGDDSDPGIGDRELSAIAPDKRTTPAGRFVAGYGPAYGRRDVLWIDYSTAVSLHPVVTANRKERRLQRLKSPAPEDNRITYGCINVPADFYTKVVRPLFTGTRGVVYILPETKPVNEVFLAYRAPGQ